MAYQWVQHSRTFVPSEAYEIAAQFRGAASEVRDLAAFLRSTESGLDTSWEGQSKDHFLDAYTPVPGSADDLATWLETAAAEIENITVTETWPSWEWAPDPEAAPQP